ncbi:RodZ domain-containing protein [Bowmanella dokdonensis]|uniref:DUF4115 domain-containing protein n=1 Tax=Bowmanella dokdonensis TaxID=751969 RepID=A0A939DQB7_9ALTE|nr:RodZ domain-containing protein [Bowmanella dokdonensis]MBN7826422.1 DUF4115 domain-containing protein [Bowmanella dokdonensis]
MTEEQEAEVQARGPGQMVREAREAKGLTMEEVAKRLNLKLANIQGLENEQFDDRISVTFTRGYYKLYARLLEIPEQQVIAAFDELNAAKQEPAKLQSFSRKVAKQASDDRLMLLSYLILAVIVALVVVWWVQQSDSLADVESDSLPPPSSQIPVHTSPADKPVKQAEQVKEAPDDTTDSLTLGESLAQSAPTQNASVESQAQEPAPTDDLLQREGVEQPAEQGGQSSAEGAAVASEQTELADPVELVFEFSGDCWVNIVDATGEAIAYGVKISGRVMPVTGVPPFDITLGAPESVSILYQGEAVDMSRFGRGRTARFTLPFSE